ncbi:MAG TPA: hypothetical protein VE309_04580 [Caulobacteraceae bacterium]|nr:hypothetical protein [Caulobacteraceae bacterium]
MRANLVLIENEADLAAARALVSELMDSTDAADVARLRAQAQILQAYEAVRWPTQAATPAEILEYLMDQHDLTPADLKPYLGAVSRVSEIRNGTKGFTLPQIRRLHQAYHIPADALIAEPA